MKLENDDKNQKICLLTVGPSNYNFWILGDAFIRDFYIVLDYDRGVVDIYGDFEIH